MSTSRSQLLTAALLGFGLALGAPALDGSWREAAAQSDSGRKVSAKVGKPLQEAQKLAQEKKFRDALAKVKEADAVSPKTAFDQFTIDQMKTFVYTNLGDYRSAAAAMEAAIASGFLSPAETQSRLRAVASLYYQAKDMAKAESAAQRYIQQYGAEPQMSILLAGAAYERKDFATASKSAKAAIDASRRAGKKPDEAWMQLVLRCEYELKNRDGITSALEQLVADYPSKDYWRDLLLSVEQRPGFSREVSLDLYRLMNAVGVMNAEEHIEMAELSLINGFPGEAEAIISKGLASGILGQGAEGARHQRLLTTARQKAQVDKAELAQLEREAVASGSGQPLAALGEAYLGYGNYAKANTLLAQAIAKGGLKSADKARLHAGIANFMLGEKEAARKRWGEVKGKDGTGALARYWTLHSNQSR